MRFGLSAIEKRDVWIRWKAGQSLHEIGRAFDKPHSCIRAVLLPRGGIPPASTSPLAPFTHLAEREDISRGIACGLPIREIARRLDRAASTLSREISRHGGRPTYRALDADDHAWVSALRPKGCLLAGHVKLRNIVASKLILNWSPEQISGWLKIQFSDDASMRVSHETIYRSLFIQARGVLKKELMDHLRSKRRMRRSRHATVADIHGVRSSMPSRSAKDLRRWKTGRFLVIGKAICSAAPRTVTSRRWWNAIHDSPC